MKHLQFLIFISGLVFTFSQDNNFDECGQTEGIEVLQISVGPGIITQEKISFNSGFSYIILWTEYNDSVPTNNVSSEKNKKIKMKFMNCFGRSSYGKIKQKTEKKHFRYTIYYIITSSRENYEGGVNVTADYVGELFESVKERTNHPVTIVREQHEIKSKELRSLLFLGKQTSEVISDQWRRSEKIKFDYKLLSKLYRLMVFKTIEELPADKNYINTEDAFVAYYDTKLIAVTTSNKKLQNYTNNFVEFIQRCSSEELEVYQVKEFNFLFQNIYPSKIHGDINEHHELYEYTDTCNRVGSIDAKTGFRNLSSGDIKENRHYILENKIFKEVYIFIKPSIKTKTLKCLLKQEKNAIYTIPNKYKINIFQPHKLNLSVLTAFKDLTIDLFDNNVTDNVSKFITVCKDKYWYNRSIEFPGSTSSLHWD